MEKRKTPAWVYIVLIAVIVALGVFIVQRLHQNAEDDKAIKKMFDEK